MTFEHWVGWLFVEHWIEIDQLVELNPFLAVLAVYQ
jgi:hypothetical protein